MPSLAASSRRSFPTWPMADSARLALSLRSAATLWPGAALVPRAEAIMLMGCRLSMATIFGCGSSRIALICRRSSWSRVWA